MSERIVAIDDAGRAAAARWASTYLADQEPTSSWADAVIVSRPPSAETTEVVEGCPGIVVWVPPGWTPGEGPIVAATGHDLTSDAGIAPAIDLARRGSRAVVLAHVWGMPAVGVVDLPPDPWGIGSIPDGQSAAAGTLASRLQATATAAGVSITAAVRQDTHVARGLVAASQGADGIVVGRPRPRGGRHALGAVARGLIELSPCPVVIVPHPGAMKDFRP
jgi:nucleotide-binding universal stress UspA family protein